MGDPRRQGAPLPGSPFPRACGCVTSQSAPVTSRARDGRVQGGVQVAESTPRRGRNGAAEPGRGDAASGRGCPGTGAAAVPRRGPERPRPRPQQVPAPAAAPGPGRRQPPVRLSPPLRRRGGRGDPRSPSAVASPAQEGGRGRGQGVGEGKG